MDNRERYFASIHTKLSTLESKIHTGAKLNMLTNHVHAETFYSHLVNLLFNWKSRDLNLERPNVEGIDLIDEENKIVFQVSGKINREKIENALKYKHSCYDDHQYRFKFISISRDANNARKSKKPYKNPHNLTFFPAEDIYDVPSILTEVKGLASDKLLKVYRFFEDEFTPQSSIVSVETNLANIIGVLAAQNWGESSGDPETEPYEIDDKIDKNRLVESRDTIEKHAVHESRLRKIYAEFDSQAANKSLSVMNRIRRIYRQANSKKGLTPDEVFEAVVDKVVEEIRASVNYSPMPYEELELCAEILVVDTFVQCKIFKRPTSRE